MFQHIARRLRSARESESGFTIIEVMVAMTIFALIAAGIAAGITSSLVLSNDSRARSVASTIAMDDIDQLRDLDNVFDIKSTTSAVEKTIGGRKYSLSRSVAWTRSSGSTTACGTGTGKLAYKSVTETVSWKTSGSSSGSQKITMSTAIAPLTNINSDTTGSILIGVTRGSGLGLSGITPTVTGPSAVALPATDAEGCTYITGVAPGTYTVTLSRTGYVDATQQNPSSQTVTVAAGASGAASFAYDAAKTYAVQYTNATSTPATLATNMPTTFVNPTSGATQVENTPTSATLFPFSAGYRVVAGSYVVNASGVAASTTCLSPDSGSWTTANSAGKKGAVTQASDTPLTAQMGAVKLTGLPAGKFLTLKTTAAGSGDPGCAAGMTLAFPKLTADNATIALPWGTWKAYVGNSSGSTTTGLTLKPETAQLITNGAVGADGSVMLDPRAAS